MLLILIEILNSKAATFCRWYCHDIAAAVSQRDLTQNNVTKCATVYHGVLRYTGIWQAISSIVKKKTNPKPVWGDVTEPTDWQKKNLTVEEEK